MEFINRLKVLLLLFLLCAFVSMASADAFKPAILFPTGAVHSDVLPNGVRVIVRPTPGSGVVSLQVWAEAGSRFETNANNGATHLIELLAMQGSRKYPTETAGSLSGPQTQLENLGGDVNSITSRDDVFWGVTLAPSLLTDAAKIMADAVLHPTLDDGAVAAAKTVAASEVVSSNLDPVSFSADLAYSAAFKKHPYGKTVQGSMESLNQLSGHAVREYYKQRFTGSHIRVIVVGDIDAATATDIITKAFAETPKTLAPDAPIPVEAPLKDKRQITQRGYLPIKVITYAWRSPAVKDAKDAVATDVLLTYLNEGSKAALRQALQNGTDDESEDDGDDSLPAQPSGLAGGFGASYLTQRDSGLFLISIVAPIQEEEAKSAVLELVDKARHGLSSADLQRAKTLLRRQYTEQAADSAGQAGALGFYDAIDSYKFAVDYLDRVQQTSNADIASVAQKYFSLDNYVQVTLLPMVGNPGQQNPGGGGIIASLPNRMASLRIYHYDHL